MDLYPKYTTSSLLARMPAPERRFLASVAREKRFAPGDLLLEEGAPAETFYIVGRGTVEITTMRGGATLVVDVVGPGGLVGLSWLCADERWRWSARAATRVVAAGFPAAAVKARCEVDERLRLIFLDEVNAALFALLDRVRSAAAA